MPESDKKPSPPKGPPVPKRRDVWRWIWPLVIILAIWAVARSSLGDGKIEVSYTLFKEQLAANNVMEATSRENKLTGEFKVEVSIATRGGQPVKVKFFRTVVPAFGDEDLMRQLEEKRVTLNVRPADRGWATAFFVGVLPIILLIGFWWLMMRRAGSQLGGLQAIGKSRAKRFSREKVMTTFEDVAGVKEAKEELQEVIGFLKRPERFRKMGCSIPKGVLLLGPPGVGKTLLARAVAGEADVPFFIITGSDFMELFVGVGAARVRDLFSTAKRHAPSIIFLDELDSVGRHRGAGLGGGHDEREQTLNQMLSEMDGFEETENVVVIAATNRPDILDPALLRPGRFDRQIVVALPTVIERLEILKVHTRKVLLGDDVDLEEIARGTPGHSGADLKNLVNEAALLAVRRGKSNVGPKEFSEARDRVLMGRERESVILKEEEKHAIALHESGHTLMAYFSEQADPIHKVTIIPRGRSLGSTQQLPLSERYNFSMRYLETRLAVLLGGRAAEELELDSVTSGAQDDLIQATRLARKMVASWGMSEKFGNLAFEDPHDNIFLGEQIAKRRSYSEATEREIDVETKAFVDRAHDRALALLKEHKADLGKLAAALEERETLSKDEIDRILSAPAGRRTAQERSEVSSRMASHPSRHAGQHGDPASSHEAVEKPRE